MVATVPTGNHKIGVRYLARTEMFLFATAFRISAIQPLLQGVLVALRKAREAKQMTFNLHPVTKVKNACSFSSTPLYIFPDVELH
jgi:hypothetical protein